MVRTTTLSTQLIACTAFTSPTDIGWSADKEATPAEALTEFAGRARYETFGASHSAASHTASYIHHMLEVGHAAALEHASATVYVRGLSSAASQDLMRHRHFSVSQLSQRHVAAEEAAVVVPPAIAQDEELGRLFQRVVDNSYCAYEELLQALEEKLAGEPNALLRHNEVRQTARAVLPHATETRLVVTGNLRAWRHFIALRAIEHADVELRTLAVDCLKLLAENAPAVFDDFEIVRLSDGTEMAESPYLAGR